MNFPAPAESQHAPTPEALAALADRARLGDMESLGALYDHYSGPLWSYVHRTTGGDRSLTDDITSATWEKVVDKIATYDPERAGFARWLYVIAGSMGASTTRRIGLGVRKELQAHLIAHGMSEASLDAGPDQIAERADEAARLAKHVNTLPERQRNAVLLTIFDGLSLHDAAQAMGVTSGSVKMARLRGLETLRKKLGPVKRADSASPRVQIVNVFTNEVSKEV